MIKPAYERYIQIFDDGMEFCLEYRPNRNQPEWEDIREQFAETLAGTDGRVRTPKIIHQIWFGGPLPAEYVPLIQKMKDVNPDYEHRLWTESNIDFELLTGDLIGRVENPGQKSDILRYEILKKFGGIYVDMDFEAIRPFDELISLNFFTGIVYHESPSLANGLIGCISNHPIIEECLRRVSANSEKSDFQEIMKSTGPFLLTDVFMKMYRGLERCIACPNSFFYPYPNDSRYRTRGDNWRTYLKPESLCVHLWHCSWIKSRTKKPPGWIKKIKTKFMFSKVRWYLNVLACGLEIDLAAAFRRAKAFPQFYKQLQSFKKLSEWTIQVEPRLGDKVEQAGALGEYFWQDLFVAKRVFEIAPERHIDVGSRIDGFVGHIACLRSLDVLDIRPLAEFVPGVSFHQVDITNPPDQWQNCADCVTCLHSIEHFGLGRYGDPIDANGWKSGLMHLAAIVRPGGRLILSTPVGSQRIKFNSHRIFDPMTIRSHAESINLGLDRFAFYSHGNSTGLPIVVSSDFQGDFAVLATKKYSLGIFEFVKSE